MGLPSAMAHNLMRACAAEWRLPNAACMHAGMWSWQSLRLS